MAYVYRITAYPIYRLLLVLLFISFLKALIANYFDLK